MVIYIDGPNNTGKTTLIKELAKRLEKDYKVSIFHCDEKFENTFEAYNNLINAHTDDILLLDRGWLGEQVYPYLRKRAPKLTYWSLSRLSNKQDVVTIFTTGDTLSIKRACKAKGEDFDNIETLQELSLFDNIRAYFNCQKLDYYVVTPLIDIEDSYKFILDHIEIPDKCKKQYFVKGYADDAGVDILLDKKVTFVPGETQIVELPVKITPKEGTMAYLIERTSAAMKCLFVHSCPIDANYTGRIHSIVYNSSKNYITYNAGEAFCQVVPVTLATTLGKVPCKKEGKRTDSCFGGTDGNTSKNGR